MAAKTTYDFDMMLSNAREAYGEELYKMACEGKDFVFTYSDNVAPSSSAGKLLKELESMGLIEKENELDGTYKVLAAFHYIEDLIDCITISEEVQNEIPE